VVGSNLDMSRPASRSINQDRTDRGLIGVAGWQASETVTINQFLSSLTGKSGLRIGIDCPGGEQRFLNIAPATSPGMSMGAFLGNRRRSRKLGIEMWKRVLQLPAITRNNLSRLHFPMLVDINEASLRTGKTGTLGAGGGQNQHEAEKEEKTDHANVLIEGNSGAAQLKIFQIRKNSVAHPWNYPEKNFLLIGKQSRHHYPTGLAADAFHKGCPVWCMKARSYWTGFLSGDDFAGHIAETNPVTFSVGPAADR
jgi:hypothetical protein